MTANLNRLTAVPKAEFDLSSLTSSFQPLNGTGFSNSVKVWKMYNPSTTISIEISLDGVTPHDFIPPLGAIIIDVQANHADNATSGGNLNVSKNQIIWGREATNPLFFQIIGFR